MKFGTRYESPTSDQLGVDGSVCWFQRKYQVAARWRREKQPRRGSGWRARGPSGTGLRVTCRTDWSFLAPYQGRKTESGSGSVAVAAATVSDGAGCAGVEDGVDRKEAY